jgi:hypothetical protein
MAAMTGSANHGVRAFAPWRPTSKSRALLETVQGILTEYRAYLRLTIRQVFYRLVGVYGYPKTERAYKICVNCSTAHGVVAFSAIRDDGIVRREPLQWKNATQFVQGFVDAIETFRLGRQQGQPHQLAERVYDFGS